MENPNSPILNTPEPSVEVSQPQTALNAVLKRISLLIAVVLFAATAGVGGYYAGTQQSKSNDGDLGDQTPQVNPQTSTSIACTEEAKLCPDGSSVGRTGPNCEFVECPELTEKEETWQRKQYVSNGQIVWDILQPLSTQANESGLHEGYLAINSVEDGKTLMAEFSYPIFGNSIPTSLEEWSNVYKQELMRNFTIEDETNVVHPQAVPIKIIKTISINPGGTKQGAMPMNFVLIWKHQSQSGEVNNPSIITVKPNNNPTLDAKIVDSFTDKLVQGIRF